MKTAVSERSEGIVKDARIAKTLSKGQTTDETLMGQDRLEHESRSESQVFLRLFVAHQQSVSLTQRRSLRRLRSETRKESPFSVLSPPIDRWLHETEAGSLFRDKSEPAEEPIGLGDSSGCPSKDLRGVRCPRSERCQGRASTTKPHCRKVD